MAFWTGRRVLITGHTGFKGSWLSHWLLALGARVEGLSLEPTEKMPLFGQLGLADRLGHRIGDIRDLSTVERTIAEAAPEVVFHMAAQSLVRRSYKDPIESFASNVMGTAHVLEALRPARDAVSAVIVTTDKVYENPETGRAFLESDPLGGHDPYSASKAAAEIVSQAYRRSFFSEGPVTTASARAGNVIGGGDWAADRIVPDAMRTLQSSQHLNVRNPDAVRPWQHVLDPLAGYMRLAQALSEGNPEARSSFNFGPRATELRSVRDLLKEISQYAPLDWKFETDATQPHEADLLMLDVTKARDILNWSPAWGFSEAIRHTVDWYQRSFADEDPALICDSQIAAFEAD